MSFQEAVYINGLKEKIEKWKTEATRLAKLVEVHKEQRENLRAELSRLKIAFDNMGMRKINDMIQKVLEEN